MDEKKYCKAAIVSFALSFATFIGFVCMYILFETEDLPTFVVWMMAPFIFLPFPGIVITHPIILFMAIVSIHRIHTKDCGNLKGMGLAIAALIFITVNFSLLFFLTTNGDWALSSG